MDQPIPAAPSPAYDSFPGPEFTSHKIVKAFKINEMEFNAETGKWELRARHDDAPDGWIRHQIAAHIFERFSPYVDGYWVCYNDGYQSFSPAKAFEEGYTRNAAPAPC